MHVAALGRPSGHDVSLLLRRDPEPKPPPDDDRGRLIADWYAAGHRDLPWRHPGFPAWGILVSRVHAAADPGRAGDPAARRVAAALADPCRPGRRAARRGRARLGPARLPAASAQPARRRGRDRRAARQSWCRATSTSCSPCPGVGPYTARAVAAFAYGVRTPVVDTNVRRVLARALGGHGRTGPAADAARPRGHGGDPAAGCPSARGSPTPARWSSGRRCARRAPRAARPARWRRDCAWRAAGYPEYEGPRAPRQKRYEGSDRQVRGLILRELRAAEIPVPARRDRRALAGCRPARPRARRPAARRSGDRRRPRRRLPVARCVDRSAAVGSSGAHDVSFDPARIRPEPRTTNSRRSSPRFPTELKIERDFPPAAQAEADARRPRRTRPSRTPDRTDIEFVTIDPAGSTDLDQALRVEREGGGLPLLLRDRRRSRLRDSGRRARRRGPQARSDALRGGWPHPAASRPC